MQTTVEKWVKVIVDSQRFENLAIRHCPLDRHLRQFGVLAQSYDAIMEKRPHDCACHGK
jgi:hypothetical protein